MYVSYCLVLFQKSRHDMKLDSQPQSLDINNNGLCVVACINQVKISVIIVFVSTSIIIDRLYLIEYIYCAVASWWCSRTSR